MSTANSAPVEPPEFLPERASNGEPLHAYLLERGFLVGCYLSRRKDPVPAMYREKKKVE